MMKASDYGKTWTPTPEQRVEILRPPTPEEVAARPPRCLCAWYEVCEHDFSDWRKS